MMASVKDIDCGGCGIVFGVPNVWLENRKRSHKAWWCPNGCCRAYQEESDVEKAQRLAREAQARVNQEQHLRLVAERERDKVLLQKKRLEKRVARGVCTCCNRTFENLARHMVSKHAQEMLLPGTEKRIEGTVQ